MAKPFEVRGECYFECVGLRELGIQPGDEVAGISRHGKGLLRSRGFSLDHISDLNEMVLHTLTAVETGGAGGKRKNIGF